MSKNQRPCPACSQPMHRQSSICRACYSATQRTPESRARMSESRKGKPSYERTPEWRAQMSARQKGKPRPWLVGRKHSEATKKKMAASWTPERRAAARERGLLDAENREWLVAIAEALSGDKNPNYQGKGKATPYAPGWGRGYRARIRARAAGICEACKARAKKLDLHHTDFSTTDHAPENLAVLCRRCHKQAHAAHRKAQQA